MDAVKILGSLLSNNAMGSDVGGSILGSLLGGGQSSSGGAGDILGTLLGGRSRSGGGGLGALGGLLAAAARSQSGNQSGGGIGMLGELLGGGAGSGNLGGLGSLLGGGAPQKKSGLGGLLGGLLGGGQQQQSSGGAADLLGSLLGGGAGGGSGADLLSGLVASAGQNAGGGELLGMLLGKGKAAEPPKEAQEEAETLIQAMCNAAKSDGKIDESERDAILGRLGDLDEKEVEYLREHLSAPLDIDGFIRNVPADMAEQVYAFSLMAIKLDTQKEAEYFGKLANGLKISGDTANEIHARLGQPEIFA
ncbi:DUF533 domain-containing protein [Verrucomicrobiales bacterium BCK34]|nr:DUF533 domain-containing protein [Verrucomicrobiales bacterium BCK34]